MYPGGLECLAEGRFAPGCALLVGVEDGGGGAGTGDGRVAGQAQEVQGLGQRVRHTAVLVVAHDPPGGKAVPEELLQPFLGDGSGTFLAGKTP